MTRQSSFTAARNLVQALRSLHNDPAPDGLVANVLQRVGLGDAYMTIDTAIGPLLVAYNDLGISTVMRDVEPVEFERHFRARFGRPIRKASEPPADLASAIQDQLNGVPDVHLRFDLRGLTEFERAVLLKALEIPHGEVRPYNWIAREIDRPRAVRAVGTALGHNPVPLLIPCHRVVHSDGHIGNYIFGSEVKRAVLNNEGAAPDVLETLARRGVRYLADPADGSFCYPSCGQLHLRTGKHLIPFHSDEDARAAGFQACSSCRPPGATAH